MTSFVVYLNALRFCRGHIVIEMPITKSYSKFWATQKTHSHDAISYTQRLSNSLIHKLSLYFQHNSTVITATKKLDF